MRPRHTLSVSVVTSACALALAGCEPTGDGVRLTPVPELLSEPVVALSPSVDRDGVPWARAGATLSVTLDIEASQGLDEASTSVTFTGVPLTPQGDGVWSRTLDGTEGEGPKTLDVVLVDRIGQQVRITTGEDDPVGQVGFDFTPPVAGCLLQPAIANAVQEVTLDIQPSEDLDLASVVVTASTSDLTITDLSQGDRIAYGITPVGAVNVPAYTLDVTATDLVGNPQDGPSLCSRGAPEGTLLAVPPRVQGDVVVTAEPSVDLGGVLHAPIGSRVSVRIPTIDPLDTQRTRVQLSDLALTFDTDATWTGEVVDGIGDGLKDLDATLVDAAGNTLALLEPKVLRTDTTDPFVVNAVLTRSPYFAPAFSQDRLYVNDVDPFSGGEVSAVLTLVVSEALADDVVLTPSGPGVLEVDGGDVVGGVTSFTFENTATVAEGTYTFTVTMEDPVGNTATEALDVTLVIDRTAPDPAADVETEGGIVYHRQPWGLDANATQRRQWVSGEAGSVPAGAVVLLLDEDDGFLSNALADSQGAFDDLRSAADLPSVRISHLDSAGNRAPSLRVRDGEWTATPGNKRLGTVIENPHVFGALGTDDGTLRAAAVEATPADGPVTTPGSVTWTPLAIAGRPSGRRSAAMVYDPAHGELVLHGGTNAALNLAGRALSDTWTFADGYWVQRAGQNAAGTGTSGVDTGTTGTVGVGGVVPDVILDRGDDTSASIPTLEDFGMAWDGRSGGVLVFGGLTSADTPTDAMWLWTGSGWTPIDPDGPRPPAQRYPKMTWDPDHGVVVLLSTDGTTWTWNGTRWTAHGAHGMPTASATLMAADPAGGGVLFNTASSIHSIPAQTWRWNGATWSTLSPATDASGDTMAADPTGQRVVLMDVGFDTTDTWVWDGATWSMLPRSGPQGRLGVRLGWDPHRQAMIQVGGYSTDGDNDVLYDDVWWLDGDTWREIPRRTARPPIRADEMFGTDLAQGALILFGGIDPDTSEPMGDLWRFAGETWQALSVDPMPPDRWSGMLAWDWYNEALMLFGGRDADTRFDDTWLWDGQDWIDVTPADPRPSPRTLSAMAPFEKVDDFTIDQVVLFGGYDGSADDETWRWNGVAWSNVPRNGVPPVRRYLNAMAFDRVQGEMVHFGGLKADPGLSTSNETHTWYGGLWTPHTPATTPPARYEHGMATDAVSGRTLMFGGDNIAPLDDLWVWMGSTWVQAARGTVWPEPRHNMAFVEDFGDGSALMYGGKDFTGYFSDLWRLDLGAEDRPAHRWTVDWTAAGAEDATIDRVVVDWEVGGTGEASHGVQVRVWSGDRWVDGPTVSAGWTQPDTLCWMILRAPANDTGACSVTVDATLLDRLIHGSTRDQLVFLTRPLSPNGSDGVGAGDPWGRLRTTDVRTRVRYRLPEE